VNKEDRSLFLPLAALLIAVIAFFVSWKLLMPSITDNQAKIAAYNADIALAEAKSQSINDANKRLAAISGLVNQLLIAIPEDVNAPDLIAEIEATAAVNQVDLSSISPPGSSGQGIDNTSSGLSTTITVSGGFANLYNFINSLENSIRFAKITGLSISSGESGLGATITFDVFARPNSSGTFSNGGDYE
jgi:Tfp pilus assembly protein PilO